MFCKNCGKELADNTKFCEFCGADQNAKPAPEKAPEPAPAEGFDLFKEGANAAVKVDKIINDKVDPFIVKRGFLIALALVFLGICGVFFGNQMRMAHFDDDEAQVSDDYDDIDTKFVEQARKASLFLFDGDDFDYESVSFAEIVNSNDEIGNATLFIGAMTTLGKDADKSNNASFKKDNDLSGGAASAGMVGWGIGLIVSFVCAIIAFVYAIKALTGNGRGEKINAWNSLHTCFIALAVAKIMQFLGGFFFKLGTDKVAKDIYESIGKDKSDAYHLIKVSPIPVIWAVIFIALTILAGKVRTHMYQLKNNERQN